MSHSSNALPISIRPTVIADLDALYTFQLHPEAIYLAAFMSPDYADKEAYLAKHTRLLKDTTVNNQTILFHRTIVGSIAKFEMEGKAEITYWIDRKFWGQGIASAALHQFLQIEPARPLYARVAFDNLASQKVIEHAGFKNIGADSGYAEARGKEIIEFIFILE